MRLLKYSFNSFCFPESNFSCYANVLDALRFSLEANPVEIPLPDGASQPNAAMTPAPSIPSQFLMPQARSGILKHPRPRDEVERGEPPGPPCGLAPSFGSADNDADYVAPRRKVRFVDSEEDNAEAAAVPDDEDLAPVESQFSF